MANPQGLKAGDILRYGRDIEWKLIEKIDDIVWEGEVVGGTKANGLFPVGTRGRIDVTILSKDHDPINHPPHYTSASIEPIDVIEAWGLGFHLGNTVKYIARAEHKGSKLTDLRKALWYLSREIKRLEEAKAPPQGPYR